LKKSTKIIAISIPTAFFALYVPLFLIGLTFPGSNSDMPSECSTGFKIIYEDVTKHNESKIREAIHLSNIDGSEYGAYQNWWDYIKVSKPGSDGTSSMGVPGVFFVKTVKVVRKLLQV